MRAERASKDAARVDGRGRPPFETRLRRAPQGDGESAARGSAALGIDRFAVVAILGAIAALGGSVLAAHFAVTIARITGYAGPSPADPALAVPLETWLVAILLGGIGGGATGIDLGTLVLIVGGRTPWDLPPATTMTAVVALPLVGLLPLAVAVGAAARRAWLRRPVLVAGVTWLAGSVAGTIVSGVWSHLPGV